MLLETLGQALTAGHILLDAARDAAVLALGYSLRGEVVDTGREAVVDEVAEELLEKSSAVVLQQEEGRERGVNGEREEGRGIWIVELTPTNSFTWRFCMRCSRSRCSA